MRPAAASPFATFGLGSRAFSPTCGRPELLLFVWPKRSNQEKGHPGPVALRASLDRVQGRLCPPSTRSASGVFRQHIPVLAKNTRASCARPFGLILQPPAAWQGPHEAAILAA